MVHVMDCQRTHNDSGRVTGLHVCIIYMFGTKHVFNLQIITVKFLGHGWDKAPSNFGVIILGNVLGLHRAKH